MTRSSAAPAVALGVAAIQPAICTHRPAGAPIDNVASPPSSGRQRSDARNQPRGPVTPIDAAAPMLNLELADGSRLFAVMAVSDRPSVALRIHRYPKLALGDLCALGMLDEPLAEFLGAAVRARRNLIVAGGTGVGKTTLLRALAHEIPAGERIVTVEDTRELGMGLTQLAGSL